MKGYFDHVYVDPLTDFPSFFNLVEYDSSKLFGKTGAIILIDFEDFRGYNARHGRGKGDDCLKYMAQSIIESIFDNNKVKPFRTDGDEFTIILPEASHMDAVNLLASIERRFKEFDSFPGIDLHTLVIHYHNNIHSIEDFYLILFNSLLSNDDDSSLSNDKWKQNIIRNFTRRIKESLKFMEEAYDLALKDDVSGLQNSRAARMHIDKLVEQNQEFSILFIDGDNLKRFNNISYEAGNKMIRVLANLICGCLVKSDCIFRWLSGDEFIVVLQGNCDSVHFKAERIRDAVESGTKEWIYPVTVSIGVANYPEDGSKLDELVNKAEKANSTAKNTGKNKVIFYDDKISLSI
ncbi:diguanylate cyclase domain-containing protein [Vallitalea okinawensis]|uniref:diguanylate cyclase domain-containing protein n=1 Tax=Vallitalea okinawensis TaxID=2078660 RepID=UPI000CFAF628|nr:diguanylate cyclase [Vallitalea okinawensis]